MKKLLHSSQRELTHVLPALCFTLTWLKLGGGGGPGGGGGGGIGILVNFGRRQFTSIFCTRYPHKNSVR